MRVGKLKESNPVESLRAQPLYARSPRSLKTALLAKKPAVIAEVKFASPSEGLLRGEHPAPDRAADVAGKYLAAGAAAVSILTERNFFAGAPEFLVAARERHPDACLLMKDFVFDPYQLELARAIGADAVLLIVALVGTELSALHSQAKALGLSVLVETHTEAELELAKKAGAELIGVNSRDLKTLKTDLDVARRLAGKAPGALLVAESGLKTRADLDELSKLGYGGFLIGTSLMKQSDPGAALKDLLS